MKARFISFFGGGEFFQLCSKSQVTFVRRDSHSHHLIPKSFAFFSLSLSLFFFFLQISTFEIFCIELKFPPFEYLRDISVTSPRFSSKFSLSNLRLMKTTQFQMAFPLKPIFLWILSGLERDKTNKKWHVGVTHTGSYVSYLKPASLAVRLKPQCLIPYQKVQLPRQGFRFRVVHHTCLIISPRFEVAI